MGALVSVYEYVKSWFTGKPDDYNPTNDDIMKHHGMKEDEDTPKSRSAPPPKPEDMDIPTSGAAPSRFPMPEDRGTLATCDASFPMPKGRDIPASGAAPFPIPKARDTLAICAAPLPIKPEVWPTKKEFQSAKDRIQYDPEKLHFAVCGGSGVGKSSLINAFRGLKNNSCHAARVDVNETTMAITRYPDPRKELPYTRLVWYDCPGAGTLKTPGWKYFNQQGLFIFDIIIFVYATRFTEIDVSIIQNCELFNIPLFVVRSKADIDIKNIIMNEFDENDDDSDDNSDDNQTRARQLLIDSTRNDLEGNLKKAQLAKRDVFIVSSSVIFSLVTGKRPKENIPEIDEIRLIEAILETAHARRYGNQAQCIENQVPVDDLDDLDDSSTNSWRYSPLALPWY